MTDLADRISRAAVAALDLAPFDDRYASLSRQVLAGGASRFSKVIANDQALHYVIPVGLVGERVAYGALVLQDHQAGVLWRDADGLDRAVVVARDDAVSATFSPVILGSQEWMRFDVTGGSAPLSFLAPPVAGSLLDRALIDFFRAKAGARSAVDVFIATDDDPETTAVQPPVVDEPSTPAEPASPAQPEIAREPAAAVAPVVADLDATAVYTPFADGVPAEPARGAGTDTGADAARRSEATRTTAIQQAPVPAASAQRAPLPAASAQQAPPPAASAQETVPLVAQPFGLYRDEAPVPQPTDALPVVLPQAPAPTPVRVGPIAAQVTEAPQPSMSRTTAGFLVGFFGILLIGGLAIAVRLLGS